MQPIIFLKMHVKISLINMYFLDVNKLIYKQKQYIMQNVKKCDKQRPFNIDIIIRFRY